MYTILLVDDIPANIKVLIEALEDEYEIIIATNGERALRWAESDQPPDLILLDIMMPEMDGYEVCHRLKANEFTQDIPIIFVTAMHEEEDETRGLKMGAVDYVHKPYSLAIIKARIATHLAMKEQRDQLIKAEAHLQEANDSLEQRVEERTADLVKSNAKLVEEVFDHKKTAKSLEKARIAAGQATQAKRDFLDNMSHEIRTPINGIMGFTSLLKVSSLQERQKSYIDMIATSTDRLLSTVDKVLDFAKIEAEELELVGQIFNLAELLQAAQNQTKNKAQQKGLVLQQKLDATLPKLVVGDPERLLQVLVNLLENGIKFSDEGTIIIAARQHNHLERGVLVHFQITDCGVGIPVAKQRLIFGAFNQADTSNTRKYEGTGLGLTISALLVEMMDGRIWVDSQPGKGSTFHVTVALEIPTAGTQLPIWQAEQEAPTQGTAKTGYEATGINRSARILLAEDEQVNRQLLCDLLEAQGWQVFAVANGQEAVDIYKKEQIDLVLMDIQMPLMNGHEATIAIRQLEETSKQHIPIIAVTAHALAGDRGKCLEAGMDDYVAKPVKARVLLDKIHERLSG